MAAGRAAAVVRAGGRVFGSWSAKRAVDVAIQSYNKPESLLYTLMCLKQCCGDRIHTVYINDDCSSPDAAPVFTGAKVQAYFPDWTIRFRRNTRPARTKRLIVHGYRPAYMPRWYYVLAIGSCLARQRRYFPPQDDIRFQWALNSTDKEFVFLTHDDVDFSGDIIGVYLGCMTPETAIAGDLGQCWRCRFGAGSNACSPARIMRGERPWQRWPLTDSAPGPHMYDCRINEWCCLIRTSAARDMARRARCFFGNYDNGGDVGAYWFAQAVGYGYRFCDPLPDMQLRNAWYRHCWQGHAGHQVWLGTASYDPEAVRKRTRERFGCTLWES